MKKHILLLVFLFVLVGLAPSVAFAVKPENTGKPKPPTTNEPDILGYDISYPQCGRSLPTDHYFGIVGVNGGTAAVENPCLAEQLAWAKTAKTGSTQKPIQLYVNTANPGEVINLVDTWPEESTLENPHVECDGSNTLSCSWQYGWNRAIAAYREYFVPAAQEAKINTDGGTYTWWLDVETMNTWQSGSIAALERNVATLEGMTAYYKSLGATVGLYSTAYQWGEITGNYISTGSNLNGLANWRPSGSSLNNAKANCSVTPLTPGGVIALTQYVRKNLDHDYSCI